jgi:hypothetical protein
VLCNDIIWTQHVDTASEPAGALGTGNPWFADLVMMPCARELGVAARHGLISARRSWKTEEGARIRSPAVSIIIGPIT